MDNEEKKYPITIGIKWTTPLSIALVVASYPLGCAFIEAYGRGGENWTGIGVLFATPVVLLASFVVLLIAHFLKSRRVVSGVLTFMAMTIAFVAGVLYTG
jgi:hypothetical protein